MKIMVISGGQTGVDIAALDAALAIGFKTGGFMPNGCTTLDGDKPEYLEKYRMVEHAGHYKSRTWANVEKADGTLRIASKWTSPGELCTRSAIAFHFKPSLDISLNTPLPHVDVVKWIKEKEIFVLNVAGNSEQTSPGIYDFAFRYLKSVFQMLK